MQVTLKKLSLAIVSTGMLTLYGCGGGDGGTEAPPPAPIVEEPTPLEQAKAFLALVDASMATAAPASGSADMAFADACYFGDGYTKPAAIASFDADAAKSAESRKYAIGSTRTNVQVLAERTTTNTDKSSRRELDIQYQVNYADGTVDKVNNETLISGSSSGSAMPGGASCAAPDSAKNLRFYGNRKLVSASLRAVNLRNQRFSLATGAPLASAVDYNKNIQFRISDPGKFAKYVVVKGAGLPSSGVKMVSPRIQRDDPLFAGKRGNVVDWQDADNFTFCRVDSTGNVASDAADCAGQGASGNSYGSFNRTAAAADTGFDAMGFVAGGSYSVAVYIDDGWKTVNGHATQTPVATYTITLNSLPYSAVALAGSGVASDLFPRVTTSLTPVQLADNFSKKASSTMDLSWTALGAMPDAAKFGWGSVSAFMSGRATATKANWPGSRQNATTYPAAGATSITGYTAPAPSSNLVTPTYSEISIYMLNRNGAAIVSVMTFE